MLNFIKRREPEAPLGNPLPPPLDLSGARRVLVIAPHPDDETLGCGGTLAQLAGFAEITVLLVTNGDGAGDLPEGASDVRKAEMAEALKLLGVNRPITCFDEPDGRFADSPGYRSRLAVLLAQVKPNWVFLPWLQDSHSDHSRIARASCAVLARAKGVEKVLFYEIWTPVPATHVVDITSTALVKRQALLCHRTVLPHGNYVDASFGLSQYRAIYVPSREAKFAEVFTVRTPGDCGA
jgi:LmbE family N-acetylglucosaminyl deacetylase